MCHDDPHSGQDSRGAPAQDGGAAPFHRGAKAPRCVAVTTPPRTATLADPPPGPASPIGLLLVDDHPALRLGLRDLLDDQPDFQVLAVAAGAREALAMAAVEDIDVAIVDYQLDDRDGLWLSRKLKRLAHPPRVIVYSAHSDARLAAAAVVAQADALVSKSVVGAELWEVIRSVARGQRLLPAVPPILGEAIRHRFGHEEQAIFGLLWAGAAPAEIARTLAISAPALESHLGTMLHTLRRLPLPGTAADTMSWMRVPGCSILPAAVVR